VEPARCRYIARVIQLTKQQQFVLCAILTLLLVGWAVKTYRQAHPPSLSEPQLKR